MRIHYVIGLVSAGILALALGAYVVGEPARMDQARADLLTGQVHHGQIIFAENCAVCHGAAGEGLGANPPLDNPGLRATDYDTLYKVIERGRYNTAMPAWGVQDGGPLNDEAIESVIALIQNGDWADTRIVVADMGLAPRVPLSVTVPAETLSLIAALPDGEALASGVQLFAANCVACHGANGEGSGLAPALNDVELRADRTFDQLTGTIALGVPGTVMAGWGQRLTEDEIAYLAMLIQRWDELPPGAIPEPPQQPIIVTEKLLESGASLYQQSCARCHGSEGQGTRRAPALNVQSFFEKVDNDAAMIQIVTLGVPGTAMPAWGDRLGASEIEAIVAYVRAWEASAPAVAAPQTRGGGGPPWLRNNAAPNPQPVVPDQTSAEALDPGLGQGFGYGRDQAQGQSVQAPATDDSPSIDWRAAAWVGVPGVLVFAGLVWSGWRLLRLRGRSGQD